MHVRCARVVPRTTAIVCRAPRCLAVDTSTLKFSGSGAWSLPLLPHDAPQLSPQPLIQIFEDSSDLRPAEVRHLPLQVPRNRDDGYRQ